MKYDFVFNEASFSIYFTVRNNQMALQRRKRGWKLWISVPTSEYFDANNVSRDKTDWIDFCRSNQRAVSSSCSFLLPRSANLERSAVTGRNVQGWYITTWKPERFISSLNVHGVGIKATNNCTRRVWNGTPRCDENRTGESSSFHCS